MRAVSSRARSARAHARTLRQNSVQRSTTRCHRNTLAAVRHAALIPR